MTTPKKVQTPLGCFLSSPVWSGPESVFSESLHLFGTNENSILNSEKPNSGQTEISVRVWLQNYRIAIVICLGPNTHNHITTTMTGLPSSGKFLSCLIGIFVQKFYFQMLLCSCCPAVSFTLNSPYFVQSFCRIVSRWMPDFLSMFFFLEDPLD